MLINPQRFKTWPHQCLTLVIMKWTDPKSLDILLSHQTLKILQEFRLGSQWTQATKGFSSIDTHIPIYVSSRVKGGLCCLLRAVVAVVSIQEESGFIPSSLYVLMIIHMGHTEKTHYQNSSLLYSYCDSIMYNTC